MGMEMGLWVELRTPMQIQNPPPRVVCLLLLRLWCPDYLHRGTWALFVYLFAGWPASPLILTSRSTDFYGPHDMERCNMLKATRSACFGHAAQIFHMDKLFPLCSFDFQQFPISCFQFAGQNFAAHWSWLKSKLGG